MRWALFDLNGTLLDPGGVGAPVGLSVDDSVAALDEAVLAAMVDTLSGVYRPLPELLRSGLVRRAQLEGHPAGIEEAMERAKRMPPYPGAGQAIERLRGAGLEVGVLTNSATESADQALESAGLRQLMADVVGTTTSGCTSPTRTSTGVESRPRAPEQRRSAWWRPTGGTCSARGAP